MANPIIAMPGRGSDGRECQGYAKLYILRGRGRGVPLMAYDGGRRARDDEPDDEPVSGIGGNQTEAICSWCRDNLSPQEIDELVDALMALQSQSMDGAGPPDFPGMPKTGGGEMLGHDSSRNFAARYPEAARIEGGILPLSVRRQAVSAIGEAQVRSAREFAERWPQAARIKPDFRG